MKICFLGSKTYPPIMGGIETHVFEIAPRLVKAGFEISVIVGKGKNEKWFEVIDGVKIIRITHSSNKYLSKLTMLPKVLNAIKKIKPDIYHAHDATMGFASCTFLRDKPSIYTVHAISYSKQEWNFPISSIIKLYQTTAFKKANIVLCVDTKTKKIIQQYREQVMLINNGVNLDVLSHEYECPKIYDRKKIKILFIGRLVKVKGLELLFKAIQSLPKEIRKIIQIIIIGTGPLFKKYSNMIKQIPEIRMVGGISHQHIFPYFKFADIFVLPSYSEGLPISLLEAMCFKNACISTSVGDIPYRFDDNKDLLLIPPGNFIVLRNALIKMISNQQLRIYLGNNASKRINSEYSWEKIINKLIKIYRFFEH